MDSRKWKFLILGWVFSSFGLSSAQAGVFILPHFNPGPGFALGIEPEIYLADQNGLGFNLIYSQKISEISNLMGIIGSGSGPRQFRFGVASSFDIFPDAENQPGVGIAAKALFVETSVGARLELQGIPYVHKTVKTNTEIEVEPFLAFPLGVSLSQGTYNLISTLAFGAQFKQTVNISTVVELGIGLTSSPTYLSGGVVYYY